MQEEKRETQSDRHKGGLTRLTGSLPWRKSKSHNQLQHGANGDAHSIASSSSSSSSSSDGSGHDMMLDPSTNANPLHGPDEPGDRWHPDIKKKRKDVSKHTFFISNSQIRLKLFARNQVCSFAIRFIQSAVTQFAEANAAMDYCSRKGSSDIALHWW